MRQLPRKRGHIARTIFGVNVVEQATDTGDIEVLSFRLGNEEYGIGILKVQEIRGFESVTRIANAPDYLLGVINLRGQIVPVVDMRLRFNLGRAQYDGFTVVIILNIGQHVIGMVVDSVSDVVTLAPEQIRPAPALGGGIDAECLRGLGVVGERMLVLLDIERLMASPDMGLVTAQPQLQAA
jgi:purine-binding chemotaxis protein CheW